MQQWSGFSDFQDPVQDAAQGPVQELLSFPRLPADHVLCSGSVLFPGAFDRHGCPLVVFPADGLASLSSQLRQADVLDFICYCHHLHTTKQEQQCLVSVVADLRNALLPGARFIAETLQMLQLHQRMVHTVYIIQPKKKDVCKLLLKVLSPSKSSTTSFKKVLLKDIPELSNHVDRSQLLASLGGYLMYCHQSWVAFIKDIDAFVQEFLLVLQRLPSCVSMLQAFSRLPLPSSRHELQQFCSINEAKFRQIRRELSLDELLQHCESVVEKLRTPESDPCYQDMAGTALFTHTAFDMLHHHSRIMAAVEKVDLLWQQAFSRAQLQLQLFQLRDDALQTTEEIQTLLQKKLHPYKIHISKDTAEAEMLVSEFEAFIHTPAMVLVRRAEDVIHAVAEILPMDRPNQESWLLDLGRLENKLHSAVHYILQTLRAVSNHHLYYDKASKWYSLVLRENFLQELLSGIRGDEAVGQRPRQSRAMMLAWRQKFSAFLNKNPCPDVEELVHLAHLSSAIPDQEIQQAGGEMSHRCMVLRKLLLSSGSVDVGNLQKALQWQYHLLRSERNNESSGHDAVNKTGSLGFERVDGVGSPEGTHSPGASLGAPQGKPASLASFDSNIDHAARGQMHSSGQQGSSGSTGWDQAPSNQPASREKLSGASDHETHTPKFDQESVGTPSQASFQVVHTLSADSFSFEIEVERSAALPSNPWLSLPVDDLEDSYAVTVTPKAVPRQGDWGFSEEVANRSYSFQSVPSQMEKGLQTKDWVLNSPSDVEDPELGSIGDVLSSTISEGREATMSTTEGMRSLLWDSYDLHNHTVDSDGVAELPPRDWALKEQEGLRQVEQMLSRADQILEEEEHVVAQEIMLDALLRSEGRSMSSQWSSEDATPRMSSWELAEAGVLGLEDSFDLAQPDHPNDFECSSDKGVFRNPQSICNVASVAIMPDLMRELHKVHQLDQLVREENLKFHKLQCSDEVHPAELQESQPTSRCTDEKERKAENLQENLQKRLPDQTEVVGCLTKDELRRDDVEGDHCSRSDKRHSPAMLQNHCRDAPSEKPPTSMVDLTKQTRLKPVREGGIASEVEWPLANRISLFSSSDLEGHSGSCGPQQQCFGKEGLGVSQKPERLASASSPVVTDEASQHLRQAHGCESLPSPLCVSGQRLDRSEDLCTPEPSSNIRINPVGEPSHPDVNPLPCLHVPMSRKTSFSRRDGQARPESLGSTDNSGVDEGPALTIHNLQTQENDALPENVTSVDSHSLVLHANSSRLPDNHHSLPFIQSEIIAETPVPQPTAGIQTADHVKESPKQRSVPKLPVDGQAQPFQQMESSESVRSPGVPHWPGISVMECHTPIVLDTGSCLVKAGFADQDFPQVVFPTLIGMPKYEEIMNDNMKRETFIGHDAQSMRGVLALKHPIKNGIIQSWDDMEKIWHHTFRQLDVSPEDHPVLFTEAAMNPLENRQRMVEMMFEYFSVPFSYVAMQAVLALYAEGRTTGVVFDSGDGVSHSVPVFEGYSLPHAVQRFPLAGADITTHLKKLLQEQGVPMRTTAEEEIVREMKEKCCYVAPDYEAELRRGAPSRGETCYTLPDGRVIALGTERFRAAEILFRPELIGRDHYGMHESVFKAIQGSDVDLRRSFLGNIVLSGGNTLLPGLPERLQTEVSQLVPGDRLEVVRVSSPGHRDFSVWSGGAVLAGLPSFSSAWISQEEYEECGPQVVFRKCF